MVQDLFPGMISSFSLLFRILVYSGTYRSS